MFLHMINWFTFKPWHAENLLYKPKLKYVSIQQPLQLADFIINMMWITVSGDYSP